MSDYEELIKNLRSVKDTWQTQEEEWMLQAADAIEKLMALTAVPQEMSAREYRQTYDRMCHGVYDAGCTVCHLYTQEGCLHIKSGAGDKAVEIVEQWAREHPEERSED